MKQRFLIGLVSSILALLAPSALALASITDEASNPLLLTPAPATSESYILATDSITDLLGNAIVLPATPSTNESYVLAGAMLNDNADLSNLTLSIGTLAPTFDAAQTSYTTIVPHLTTALTYTPTKADPNATLVTTGGTGLTLGENTLTVLVTAEDGITTKTYTVIVTRRTIIQQWAADYSVSDNLNLLGSNSQVNLLNFAFGMNPNGSSNPLQYTGSFAALTPTLLGLPITASEISPTKVDFRALFVRRKDAAEVGLSYTTEFSNDLATWEAISTPPTILSDNGTYEVVSMDYPRRLSNGKKASFFRVRLDLN